jgi:polar amino acid transport system substrate-binding protein
MKHFLLILCIILNFLSISVANAETIRWVTESWEKYTNEDGSGLYIDIVRAVFADHQLNIINMPWKRSLLEVKNGKSDMTGATSFVDGYITSRYPILAPPISILFDKKKMSYTDLPSLKNYVAVWGRPYEDELISKSNKTFIKGFAVQERETAYKLLVSGRADYFLDSKGLHQVWLKNLEAQPSGELQASDFQLEDIGESELFMIFSDNARGQRLKVIFDTGMAKLIQKGQLRKIYEKYHLLEQMPSHFLN